MIEKDHLFQVATITKGQIKKLNQAGINTMQELATTDIEYVPGINTIVLEKLKAQAKIQSKVQAMPFHDSKSLRLRPMKNQV